ncbi:MAG: c-type cytochrome [Alphaproteobacteria bacterium]|nr:c-type cytochrome [Alphaproteobacteria bacterium]MBU1515291.1 c-type cytochrome [Alphaproteobacteria bacterium]MBU2092421.1 c-type cytochrome [Alphaproteobacteria bacterium]MBU2153015.1 c-type cytochrome [Alphaproteobacteria bacterium]MBU2305846.1 c-type cytochrome [Alphaproteobacteria bacterium]
MAFRAAALVALGLLAASAGAASAQTAAPGGATIFKQRCSVCHVPGKSLMGPDLTGVMTRKARPAFSYSPAMQKQPAAWDAKRLDAFLAGPQKAVPGTKMMVAVANPADRSQLITYMTTLK